MKNIIFVSLFIVLLGAAPVKAMELDDSKDDNRLRIELKEADEQINQARFQEYISELAAFAQSDVRKTPAEREVDDTKRYKPLNPMVLFSW